MTHGRRMSSVFVVFCVSLQGGHMPACLLLERVPGSGLGGLSNG